MLGCQVKHGNDGDELHPARSALHPAETGSSGLDATIHGPLRAMVRKCEKFPI